MKKQPYELDYCIHDLTGTAIVVDCFEGAVCRKIYKIPL